MCNLYRMRSSGQEVAQVFGARASPDANFVDELYPGYPGLVVAGGIVRAMTWGYPLALKGRQGQTLKPKAVTNARTDKLHTPFWRDSFVQRRCLVPVSAWAEAEGDRGRMTRTWYSLPGQDLFAVAGLWRQTEEWGAAYTMVMVDSSPQMAEDHDRMPVILAREDWSRWCEAPPEDAFRLCTTFPGTLVVDRTAEPWAARKPARAADSAPRLAGL